jgi:CheY-like chemotaxis protein/AcrR family transcriptional regulator
MPERSKRSSPQLRDLLVAAARELLEEGQESLDLRQVARRAGKSHTAPYIAFGSTEQGGGLEALRVAVAASGFDDLALELKAALDSAPRGAAALARVGQAYFRFAQRNVGLFRTMFGPEVARGIQRHMEDAGHREIQRLLLSRQRALRSMQAAIEEEEHQGAEFDAPPNRSALAAWSMFHGAATLVIDGQFALEKLDIAAVNALIQSFLPQPVDGLLEAADSLRRAKEEKGEAQASSMMDRRPDLSWPQDSVRLLSGRSGPRRLARAQLAEESAPYGKEVEGRGRVRPLSPAAATPALRRLRRNAQAIARSTILWVDDRPEWSRHEEQTLTRLGASVVRATSTAEAISFVGGVTPDVVVSDIARPESDRAGLEGLPEIRRTFPGVPVIFYVGHLDPKKPAPEGSFGITSSPEDLMHLILDVVERRRS